MWSNGRALAERAVAAAARVSQALLDQQVEEDLQEMMDLKEILYVLHTHTQHSHTTHRFIVL